MSAPPPPPAPLPDPRPEASPRRAFLWAGVAIVLFFAAAEVLLFGAGAAWRAWWGRGTGGEDGTGGFHILCVGDSHTFGIGAGRPEDAWPARVERRLREARPDLDVRVTNAGVPGSNSAEAEEVARGYLAGDDPPDVVIFLAGLNDSWNLAGNRLLVEAAEGGAGRAWSALDRLRTFRLLRWAIGRTPLSETRRREREEASVALGFADVAAWRDGDAARRCGRAVAERPDSYWANVCLGTALLRLGRYGDAAAALAGAEAAAGPDEVAAPVFHRAQCLRRLGRGREALDLIPRLRGHSPVEGWGAALVPLVLWDLGERDAARERVTELLRDLPRPDSREAYLVDALAWMDLSAGRVEEAEAGFARLAAIGWHPAWTLGPSLAALTRRDPRRALDLARGSARFDDARVGPWLEAVSGVSALFMGDAGEAVASMDRALARRPEDPRLRKLARFAAADVLAFPRQDGVTDVFAAGFPTLPPYDLDLTWAGGGDDEAIARALAARIQDLAGAAREAGARLIAMTYPSATDRLGLPDEAIAAAATGAGIPLIDHRRWSRAPPGEPPRSDLFVPDQHPSTRGYARMAEAVAQGISPLLPPP